MDERRYLVLDLDLCIGCRSCESACRSYFENEKRLTVNEIKPYVTLPQACKHCEEPLCLAACPFGVIKRDEEKGIVFQASFHCVGCKSCALACPFGVIENNLSFHVTQKCNLCYENEKGPRCALSCATGALKFIKESELEKVKVGVRFISRSPYWRRV
uniref:4Fe-4S dicluster domain-containing protein n=1 Tax=candidate division WOR-3 bacterium TaxID=2052148 RepID=A0A7V3ZVT1_UNCW3